MLENLAQAVAEGTPQDVEKEILNLDEELGASAEVADEVVFEILRLVKDPDLYESQKAAHLLNFFEFNARKISRRAKHRVLGFLREFGESFRHFHAVQVVAELRNGDYLKDDA